MNMRSGLAIKLLLVFILSSSCAKTDVYSTRNKFTSVAPNDGIALVGHSNYVDCVRDEIHSELEGNPIFTEKEIRKNLPFRMDEEEEDEIDWLHEPRFLNLMAEYNVKYLVRVLGENEFHEDSNWMPMYPLPIPMGMWYEQKKTTKIAADIWELNHKPGTETGLLAGNVTSSAHDEGRFVHIMLLPVHYNPTVTEGPACKGLGKGVAQFLKGEGHSDKELMPDLYRAAAQGNDEEVKSFLAKGTDVNYKRKNDETALYIASSMGHESIVKVLLAHGAYVNHQTTYGWTALMAASEGGHEKVVNMLLAKGAAVDIPGTGDTELVIASSKGHESVVKILLAHGANASRPSFGSTPLTVASEGGHESVVSALLAHGADVNQASSGGVTALMVASEYGHAKVVDILLSHGAEVNYQVPDSWFADCCATALTMAANSDQVEIVKTLIAHGANVDHQDEDGWTALMLAAKAGYEEVAKILLANGADVNLQADNGLTALKVTENKEIFRLLKSFGAK